MNLIWIEKEEARNGRREGVRGRRKKDGWLGVWLTKDWEENKECESVWMPHTKEEKKEEKEKWTKWFDTNSSFGLASFFSLILTFDLHFKCRQSGLSWSLWQQKKQKLGVLS